MKVCLFSSYSDRNVVYLYIQFYLRQLRPHFDRILLITNERELDLKTQQFLNDTGIELLLVENEGYDFGMWYKGLKQINVAECKQIAFVNDSCILFKDISSTIEQLNGTGFEFSGITSSREFKLHVQSYFTLAKGKRVLKAIRNYYESHGITTVSAGENLKSKVIAIYEIGLSQHLIKKGFKVGSLYKAKRFGKKNRVLYDAVGLIEKGYPFVKKSLFLNSFSEPDRATLVSAKFDFNINYLKIMKNYSNIEFQNFKPMLLELDESGRYAEEFLRLEAL